MAGSLISAGPLLVALGALLWATDALFRFPMVNALDPTFIVFLEHLIATAVLLPWILWKHRAEFRNLRLIEWLAAFIVGVGGSAMATVFFTASFRDVNPSIAILLQKLQPVLVTILAFIFLGERPRAGFLPWALLALGAGVVLSFPDFDFRFLSRGWDPHSRGVAYALSAAGLWALATIAGKSLLQRLSPVVATFWRYSFGLSALLFLLVTSNSAIPWSALANPHLAKTLVYMSLGPGLLALLCYYNGLARTSASVATFVELIFPVGAVALNAYFLHAPLSAIQVAAAAVLLGAITKICLT